MNPGKEQEKNTELVGPELSDDEISDLRAVFQSIVESLNLRQCCAGLMYSNWMHFAAIIQRQHAPDIIIQISNSMTQSHEDLTIRIDLYTQDTRTGMTGGDYIEPKRNDDSPDMMETTSSSILLAAERESISTTLRQLLVKLKYTFIHRSNLSPEDVPGSEGRSEYPLEEFTTIFVGEESLWSDETTTDET